MKSVFSNKFFFLTALVLGAALTRLLPHYPNFTAIGGLALFGGAYFDKKWQSFVIPFAALFLTDLLLGFHSTMFAVYGSFALIILLGMSLSKKRTVTSVLLASVTSSVLFFVITNLGMWMTMGMYPKTAAGLGMCYTAAIPFFHTTLLGDLFFTSVLFGAYELIQLKAPQLVRVKNN